MSRSKIPPNRLLHFILFLLLGAGTLAAQDGGNGKSEKSSGRLAWFVAVAVPEGLGNPVAIKSGMEVFEVTLSKRSVGDPVEIPADGLIRIIREVQHPEDPNKSVIDILAEFQIPQTVEKALVILDPLPEPVGKLMFEAKVQDLADFGGGKTLYLNVSPRDVQVEINEEVIELSEGEMQVTRDPRLDKAESRAVTYSYLNPLTNSWSKMGSSAIMLHPTRREICIFTWNPRSERISYHGVTFPVTR